MRFSSTFVGPGVQENPKQYRLLPLLWAFSQNLEVSSYCWRHHKGPRGIKPYLVYKPPPWGLPFLGLGRNCAWCWGRKSVISLTWLWYLWTKVIAGMARSPERWGSRPLSWGHPAVIYSDLRPTQEQGIHSWYGKPSPPPLAGEVIKTREDFKTH